MSRCCAGKKTKVQHHAALRPSRAGCVASTSVAPRARAARATTERDRSIAFHWWGVYLPARNGGEEMGRWGTWKPCAPQPTLQPALRPQQERPPRRHGRHHRHTTHATTTHTLSTQTARNLGQGDPFLNSSLGAVTVHASAAGRDYAASPPAPFSAPPPPLPLIPGRRAGSLRQRHRRHHQNSSRRGRHHHRPHYPHTWAPSLAAGLALPRLLPASSPPLTPPPAQRPTPNPCDHMRGVTPALSLPSLLSPSSAAAGGIPPAHTPCGRPRREPSRPCRHRHCCAAPRLRGGRAGGRAADRGCRPLTAIEPRPPPHVGRCPHTHRVSRGLQSAGGGGGHAPLTARGVADSRRVQHLPAPPDPCTARRHTAGAGAVPGAISSNKQQRGSADLRLPGVAAERTSRGGGRRTVVPPAGRPIFFPSPPQGRYVPRAFSPSPRRRDLQRKALRA